MQNRTNRGITLLVTAAAALVLLVWGDAFLGRHSVCIYHSVLGIPCPFCGLTRAVDELMHLRPARAWAFNPLIGGLVLWYVLELGCFIWPRRQKLSAAVKIYRPALAAAALLLLVLRIFKYFPLP